MTDYQNLPPSVLAKIATLDAQCLRMSEQLEQSQRDLQRVRIERARCVPNVVEDEFEANLESERVKSEWQRLDAAITAQEQTCTQLEKRLRREEHIAVTCKKFLHELPVEANLRVVDGIAGGDLDKIRQRITEVQDEISRLRLLPVPSDDLADKVRRYVEDLAARAAPVIQGISKGQTLNVLYPLNESADRVILTGFSQREGSPLLLLALIYPERLTERLLQTVSAHSISQTELNARLQLLQQQLVALRYDEEVAVCACDDVSRSGSSPPWAVLLVQVEHEQKAAA